MKKRKQRIVLVGGPPNLDGMDMTVLADEPNILVATDSAWHHYQRKPIPAYGTLSKKARYQGVVDRKLWEKSFPDP